MSKRFWISGLPVSLLAVVLSACCVSLLADNTSTATVDELAAKDYGVIDTSVTAVMPIQYDAIVVKFVYAYSGGRKKLKMNLPNQNQLPEFSGLMVKADGVWVKPIYPLGLLNPLFSNTVELSPGKSVELVVPLAKIFKMPKSWKKLQIIPVPINQLANTTQRIELFRYKDGWPEDMRESESGD